MKGDAYVYQTEPRRSIKPVDVFDSLLTGERWIIPPVGLSLESIIPGPVVEQANGELYEYVALHRKGPPIRLTAKYYQQSLDVLEAAGVNVPKWERRFIDAVREHLK